VPGEAKGTRRSASRLKIVDDADKKLARAGWQKPSDGLKVARAQLFAGAYFRTQASILDQDGFFDTRRSSATIDQHGYMHITDRSKDVIKSGGEWISSIELENLGGRATPQVGGGRRHRRQAFENGASARS